MKFLTSVFLISLFLIVSCKEDPAFEPSAKNCLLTEESFNGQAFYTYTYNANGRLIKRTNINSPDIELIYNNDGKLERKNSIYNGKIGSYEIFSYNSIGLVDTIFKHDTSGNYRAYYVFKYNSANLPIEKTLHQESDTSVIMHFVFEYNSENNLVKVTSRSIPNLNNESVKTFKYDDKKAMYPKELFYIGFDHAISANNVIEEVNETSSPVHTWNYEYAYNAQGYPETVIQRSQTPQPQEYKWINSYNCQ